MVPCGKTKEELMRQQEVVRKVVANLSWIIKGRVCEVVT